jgi:hypothetical protein
MKRLSWYFYSFYEGFFAGDRLWGIARFAVVMGGWVLWVWLASLIFGPRIVLIASPDTPRSFASLRYLIAPLAGILGALFLGSRYVQDIHDLGKIGLGIRYVWAAFFGMFYPSLEIEKGNRKLEFEKTNLMDVIGGPGILVVEPGSAVLLEKLRTPSDVCTNGVYFVKRHETVKSITDLRPRHFQIIQATATTRDGIPMTVSNIMFQYRVLEGRMRRRHATDPYSFSAQAIRNLAYNRAVSDKGITPWENAVRGAIEGAIAEYIGQNVVDVITAPRNVAKDPRAVIRDKVYSADTRAKLRNIGTELVWVDIGQINHVYQIDDGRLKAWQAKWNSHASVVRAQGEAQRFAYQELGRAETQAELLRGITNSLREMNLSGKDNRKENIRKIVLARTAQLFEAMTSIYQTGGDSHLAEQPPQAAGAKKENEETNK